VSGLSIFTPTHTGAYLRNVYASIKDQPFDEWLVLHNNGSRPIGFDDPRVKEAVAENTPPLVGALKAEACRRASGDMLLELDHDDLLAPGAVAAVRDALSGRAGFCYSNTVEVDAQFKPRPHYDAKYGWQYRSGEFSGHAVDELDLLRRNAGGDQPHLVRAEPSARVPTRRLRGGRRIRQGECACSTIRT
jgi:hypothetical protein